MIPMTLAAAAAATGAAVPVGAADVLVTSVEFDTRQVRPGALFVALAGSRVDGHDFAAAAAAAGAVAVLGSRPVAAGVPELLMPDESAVLAALAALAAANAADLVAAGLIVVGVTGSSGKTSTKDLIAAVLGRAGAVVAAHESFNNEIGHPYTVLRAGADTRFLVLELSARGPGHIAALCAVVPPRIGVVLNVGSAHLGEFGSVQAIAAAKGELVEALPSADAGGIAVLNAEDARVAAMARRTAAAVVRVGVRADAEVRAGDIALDDLARAHFTLLTPEGSAPVALRVVGAHQVGNALAAAAVGRAVGMNVGDIADALSASGPASHWRMETTELPGGITVVNDAYNANPESMRAALAVLAAIGANRRTWAVLGEMAELGPAAADAHAEVGRLVAHLRVDRLLVVGPAARPIHLAAGLEGSFRGESTHVPDAAAALAVLRRDLRPGDVVLVKASRAVGLERLALALIASASAGPTGGGSPG